MGDARWVKVEVNMFDDTKLKIIDNMPDRDSIQYMWTRFLVLGGKINCGGYFYLTDGIPYTIKTFAVEFNRSIEEVKNAIKVLKKLEMIEFTEDKVFKIKNWEKHQNVEGLERLRTENNRRVAKHRAKKKEDKFKNEEEANNNVLEIDDNNKTIENNIEEINYKEDNEKENNFSNRNEVENAADIIDDNSNDDCNVKCNDESNAICSDNTNVNCNVTGNIDNSNCNITVMEQNKKEIKNKNKIKRESNNTQNIKNKISTKCNESEILDENKESENKTLSKRGNSNNSQIAVIAAIADDNLGDFEDVNRSIVDKHMNYQVGNKVGDSEVENKSSGTQNVNSKALKILMHYEKLTGIPGVFNMGSIALAIDMHGEKFVKMAINKALELNKKDMPYINGILKNWRREGYPKDDVEVKKDGTRCIGKNNAADKNEFKGFKPKESRKLTEEQRKRAEKNLI
jgi:predicted phage replisome organizer